MSDPVSNFRKLIREFSSEEVDSFIEANPELILLNVDLVHFVLLDSLPWPNPIATEFALMKGGNPNFGGGMILEHQIRLIMSDRTENLIKRIVLREKRMEVISLLIINGAYVNEEVKELQTQIKKSYPELHHLVFSAEHYEFSGEENEFQDAERSLEFKFIKVNSDELYPDGRSGIIYV
jgi:hypothetical protein